MAAVHNEAKPILYSWLLGERRCYTGGGGGREKGGAIREGGEKGGAIQEGGREVLYGVGGRREVLYGRGEKGGAIRGGTWEGAFTVICRGV